MECSATMGCRYHIPSPKTPKTGQEDSKGQRLRRAEGKQCLLDMMGLLHLCTHRGYGRLHMNKAASIPARSEEQCMNVSHPWLRELGGGGKGQLGEAI